MCPHIGWRVSWSAEVIWVFLESTALNYGSSWPWLLVEIGAQSSLTWAHSRSQAERAVATQKKFYSKWCTGTREQVETWKAPKRSETITSIHIQLAKASHLIKTSFPLPIASVWMVGRIEELNQQRNLPWPSTVGWVIQARFQREGSKSTEQKIV